MNRVASMMLLAWLAWAMAAVDARADGGQVVATASIGGERAVMMVNPSTPCAGPVVVVVRASPKIGLVECTLRASDGAGGPPIQCAMSPDPDGLGVRAVIQCDEPALWSIAVDAIAAQGGFELRGQVRVAPVPPRWQSQWPWILAWVPGAALLLLRQSARRGAKPYDAADGAVSPTELPEIRP